MAEAKNLPVGFDVKSCSSCAKDAAGLVLADLFAQESINGMFWFDDGVMRLNEVLLMRAIQIVNPYQEELPIELFRFDSAGARHVTARR